MRAQAARHREAIAVEALGDEDLILCIRYLEGADALAVYAEFLTSRPASPRVERALADLLVVRRWRGGLDALESVVAAWVDSPSPCHRKVRELSVGEPQSVARSATPWPMVRS